MWRGALALGIVAYLGLAGAMAQSRLLRGEVVDSSGQGIAYARVVWRKAQTGVLTDSLGRFAIPASPTADTLAVSAIGFRPHVQPFSPGESFGRITLAAQEVTLAQVDIQSRPLRVSWLGPDREGSMLWANLQPTGPLDTANHEGYEVAMTYARRGGGWLRTVRLYIGSNNFGGTRMRLRFYAVASGRPTEELPAPEVTFALADGQTGWIAVPLPPALVAVPSRFAVGIEWLSYTRKSQVFRPSISLPAATGVDNRVFSRRLGKPWAAGPMPLVISLQTELLHE